MAARDAPRAPDPPRTTPADGATPTSSSVAWERVLRLPIVAPRRTLALLGLATMLSALVATGVRVDLSFRPLYLEDEGLRARSEAAYATFGQVADGMAGVLVTGDVVAPAARSFLAAFSDDVAALPGVAGVLSPTTLVLPESRRGPGAWSTRAVLGASAATDGDRAALRARQSEFPEAIGLVLAPGLDKAVVWAELAAPMDRPAEREQALAALDELLDRKAGPAREAGLALELVGYPVVERAYEGIFFVGMLKALVATTVVVIFLLLLFFGGVGEVAVALTGTGLALPVAFAVMAIADVPITLVSAALPTLLLVIGVADALHLLERYRRERRVLPPPAAAARSLSGLLRPVVWTTLTTSAGFLSLAPASLGIVRQFGAVTAAAVAALLVFNLLAVPALLVLADPASHRARPAERWLRRGLVVLSGAAARAPGSVALAGTVGFAGLLALAPHLEVSQPFNRDVVETHPVRRAQMSLEASFAGFQGPELVVARRDGGPLGAGDLAALVELEERARALVDVRAVVGIPDVLPAAATPEDRLVALGLAALEGDQAVRARRRLLDEAGARALVLVRTGDIGTARATALLDRLEAEVVDPAPAHLEVQLLGSWVRAQRGMAHLVGDLLQSLLLATLLVAGALLFLLGRRREVVPALLANVAPVLATLGVMVLLSVPLKIGTSIAVVVALGIAVDDTLHLAARLGAGRPVTAHAIRRAIHDAGPAMVLTTLVLLAGFLCLGLVGLAVVTEMGRVGAAALSLALLADLLWLPALWLLTARRPPRAGPGRSQPGPVSVQSQVKTDT